MKSSARSSVLWTVVELLGWGYPPKLSKRMSASSTPSEWSRSRTVFAIGVVQDSVETDINSSGDVFFTATAEEFDRKGKGE